MLIETILAAFEMEEIIYELRDHSAGLLIYRPESCPGLLSFWFGSLKPDMADLLLLKLVLQPPKNPDSSTRPQLRAMGLHIFLHQEAAQPSPGAELRQKSLGCVERCENGAQ